MQHDWSLTVVCGSVWLKLGDGSLPAAKPPGTSSVVQLQAVACLLSVLAGWPWRVATKKLEDDIDIAT